MLVIIHYLLSIIHYVLFSIYSLFFILYYVLLITYYSSFITNQYLLLITLSLYLFCGVSVCSQVYVCVTPCVYGYVFIQKDKHTVTMLFASTYIQ